jgi:hypothetical protein
MSDRAKTILLYGESGDSKTTQAIFLAKYIKKKFNKRLRLISSDGGGWAPVQDEGIVYHPKDNPEGYVEVFNMTNRVRYLAEWRKLSKGFWPQVLKGDAEKGEDPSKFYRHIIPSDLSNIGGYFCEGLTSLSSGFISHISKQDNSKDSVTKVMYSAPGYEQDGEYFGATDQGHVGMVQNELNNLTQQFGTLPVDFVMWTGLVGKASEKSLRAVGLEIDDMNPIYGPKLAGNAKTAESPSWFSDCFFLHRNSETGMVEAHFRKWKDDVTNNTYLAKISTSPKVYQELLRRFPQEKIEFSFEKGIDKYLEVIDEIKCKK